MLTIIQSIQSYFQSSYDWIPSSVMNTTENTNPDLSKRYAGKILLREDIPLDDPTFESLLVQRLFQAIPSIESHVWGKRCRRCGNKQRHLFANIPCARCNNIHAYCRKCVEMGRVLECEPLYLWTGPAPTWNIEAAPLKWTGSLTIHQQHASDEIKHTMQQGNKELLTWAVCGAGKTEMLFEGIGHVLGEGKRVCLATPRADVVRELIPRFKQVFPATEISGLYGGSEDKDGKGQFIIATTHQLIRFAHAFDVVIVDEIDAFPYHADKSLPFVTKRAAKPDAAMIYLTATPRKDQLKRINAKQLPTVFVPVRFHGKPLPVPKPHLCMRLRHFISQNQAPPAFYKWFFTRKNPNRQVLIFVPTIELAEGLVDSLKTKLNITNITAVHATDEDRAEKVQQFRNKELYLLVTTTILERGVTFPSVDVVVLDADHEVFDEAALVQIAGRAGRSPDDPTGEVIFLHDGKTDAMVRAVHAIKKMNKKGAQTK